MLKMIKEIISEIVKTAKQTIEEKWKKYQVDKNCIDGNGHVFVRSRGSIIAHCKKCPKSYDIRKYCFCGD